MPKAVKWYYQNSANHRLRSAKIAETYQALVVGLRDYVNHSGFKGVLVGLSGGMGARRSRYVSPLMPWVQIKFMRSWCPMRYTSQNQPARCASAGAPTQRVLYHYCPIHAAVEGMRHTLEPMFSNTTADTTEENIQTRARGLILMALSNKFGHLVITTGNNCEMAVGYATLYGDMAGGFDVIKMCIKPGICPRQYRKP